MKYRLERGETWACPNANGLIFECHQGSLWLTVTGDPKDSVLTLGDRFCVEGNGTVVVQALEPTLFAIVDPKFASEMAKQRRRELEWRQSRAKGWNVLYRP